MTLNIEKKFNEIQIKSMVIKKQMITILSQLPDNPKINKFGPGNAFTISIKDLGTTNWSTFFHNYKAQYTKLIEIIENTDSTKLVQRIVAICAKKGAYIYKHEELYFNPEVIKMIEKEFKI